MVQFECLHFHTWHWRHRVHWSHGTHFGGVSIEQLSDNQSPSLWNIIYGDKNWYLFYQYAKCRWAGLCFSEWVSCLKRWCVKWNFLFKSTSMELKLCDTFRMLLCIHGGCKQQQEVCFRDGKMVVKSKFHEGADGLPFGYSANNRHLCFFIWYSKLLA